MATVPAALLGTWLLWVFLATEGNIILCIALHSICNFFGMPFWVIEQSRGDKRRLRHLMVFGLATMFMLSVYLARLRQIQ